MTSTTAPQKRAKRATSPKTSRNAESDLTDSPAVRELLGDSFLNVYQSIMKTIDWAEEEIETMSRAHPDFADRLWHSFKLLQPTNDLMRTEFVYRSHCRELLSRIVEGEDTRPGTAAECCLACSHTSELAPLSTAGTGFYMRMWSKAAFPDLGLQLEPYEALKGEAIDDHERSVRRKLTQRDRQLHKVIEHSTGCPDSRARQDAGCATEPPAGTAKERE